MQISTARMGIISKHIRVIVTLCAVAFLSPAVAWRSGLNTTFDPSQFPGAIIKNFITDYSAVCDGVASDDTALTNWLSDGVAAGTTQIVLNVPSGKNCNFPSGRSWTEGIKKVVIWGYGASWNSAFIGAHSPWQDTNTKSAKIQTVTAGSSAVQLITASDGSIFTTGDNVAVGCLSLQQGGYPPNIERFSYHTISSITGSVGSPPVVFNLSSPTIPEDCKSTFPQVSAGSAGAIGPMGPAVIYQILPNFNTDATYIGLTNTYSSQPCVEGKTITLIHVNLSSASSCVTMADTVTMTNTTIKGIEVDKVVNLWSCTQCVINQIDGQSSSLKKMSLSWSTVKNLNGSVRDVDFFNSSITITKFGPTGYGHGGVLNSNGSTLISAPCTGTQPVGGGSACGSAIFVTASNFSFSGGVFTIADSNIDVINGNVARWAVPGQKFYFGDSDGTMNCVATPQSACTFSILDVSDNGTNTLITTDIVGSLPVPTCNGHSCPTYTAYQASSATQVNSGGGSVNLLPYAAPP